MAKVLRRCVQLPKLFSMLRGAQGVVVPPSVVPQTFWSQVGVRIGFRPRFACGLVAWRLVEEFHKDITFVFDAVAHFSSHIVGH